MDSMGSHELHCVEQQTGPQRMGDVAILLHELVFECVGLQCLRTNDLVVFEQAPARAEAHVRDAHPSQPLEGQESIRYPSTCVCHQG